MKVRKGTKSEVALEGVATCTARGIIVPIVSISSKIDASTCFLSPSLHLAVGVHENGRGQSAGEDFRGQIFKVGLSFFLCQPSFESVWMFADEPPSRFSDTTPVHRGRRPAAASLRTSSVSTSPSSWQVSRDASRHSQRKPLNVALRCVDVPTVLQGGTTSSAAVFLRRRG